MEYEWNGEAAKFFSDLIAGTVKSKCCDIRPLPEDAIVHTKICFFTSKQEELGVPFCQVTSQSGTLCHVGYRYCGFATIPLHFKVDTATKMVVFGKNYSEDWEDEKRFWLITPNKVGGAKYSYGRASKDVFPHASVSGRIPETLYCTANVPDHFSDLSFKLKADVTVEP